MKKEQYFLNYHKKAICKRLQSKSISKNQATSLATALTTIGNKTKQMAGTQKNKVKDHQFMIIQLTTKKHQ